MLEQGQRPQGKAARQPGERWIKGEKTWKIFGKIVDLWEIMGFIMVYQSKIGGVRKKMNRIWELANLKLHSFTSRRVQMQVIVVHVSEY